MLRRVVLSVAPQNALRYMLREKAGLMGRRPGRIETLVRHHGVVSERRQVAVNGVLQGLPSSLGLSAFGRPIRRHVLAHAQGRVFTNEARNDQGRGKPWWVPLVAVLLGGLGGVWSQKEDGKQKQDLVKLEQEMKDTEYKNQKNTDLNRIKHKISNGLEDLKVKPNFRKLLGRESKEEEIKTALGNGSVVILYGLNGYGKTSLARKYAQNHREDYIACIEISGVYKKSDKKSNIAKASSEVIKENFGRLEAATEKIIRETKSDYFSLTKGCQLPLIVDTSANSEQIGKYLLLIDNLDDTEQLKAIIHGINTQHSSIDIIITTRYRKKHDIQNVKEIEIGTLEPDEYAEMFKNSLSLDNQKQFTEEAVLFKKFNDINKIQKFPRLISVLAIHCNQKGLINAFGDLFNDPSLLYKVKDIDGRSLGDDLDMTISSLKEYHNKEKFHEIEQVLFSCALAATDEGEFDVEEALKLLPKDLKSEIIPILIKYNVVRKNENGLFSKLLAVSTGRPVDSKNRYRFSQLYQLAFLKERRKSQEPNWAWRKFGYKNPEKYFED